MKIGINGIILMEKPAGIANLIIKTANYLVKTEEIIIYSNKELNQDVLKRLDEKIRICILPMRILPNKTTLWLFFRLSKYLKKDEIDLFWCPNPWGPLFISKKQKVLVTVHDFVCRDYRNTSGKIGIFLSDWLEKKTIKRADKIWCVSQYTLDLLNQYYPFSKKKPVFVGQISEDIFKRIEITDIEKKSLFDKLHINNNFMLFVGTIEPRKNLSFLLKLYKQYKGKLQLVIVGAKGWGNSYISDIVNSEGFPRENVIFTGFISNEDLVKLYNLATLYISTSLNEGFGLPQLEAMNCGCPVISPHNSAMIEVVFGAGLTVKDWEIDSWLGAIYQCDNSRDEIILRQNMRIKQYMPEIVFPKLENFIH